MNPYELIRSLVLWFAQRLGIMPRQYRVDLSNYDIDEIAQRGGSVRDLAGDVVGRIAKMVDFDLSGDGLLSDKLFAMFNEVAPNKVLQLNVETTRRLLGGGNVTAVVRRLLEESGVMRYLSGSFFAPAKVFVPELVDYVVLTGGVANWIMRRIQATLQVGAARVGTVHIIAGIRKMGEKEHPNVKIYINRYGNAPTEYDFYKEFGVPILEAAGFVVVLTLAENTDGDEVLAKLFAEHPEVADGTILVVGNMPNTLQTAGQLQGAARTVNLGFNASDPKLFVQSDTIILAQHSEPTAVAQNVLTALGQLLRVLLMIQKEVELRQEVYRHIRANAD